jgi:hypothetical protein
MLSEAASSLLLHPQALYAIPSRGTSEPIYTNPQFHRSARDRPEAPVDAPSSVRPVFAKRLSSPVGCSGAKKRCGRSQEPSSVVLYVPNLLVTLELLGLQSTSIASTSLDWSSSILSSTEDEGGGAGSEGTPKIGFMAGGVTIGLEDKEREDMKSGAEGVGVRLNSAVRMGVPFWEIEGGGGGRWVDVSMSRIGAGRCTSRIRREMIKH